MTKKIFIIIGIISFLSIAVIGLRLMIRYQKNDKMWKENIAKIKTPCIGFEKPALDAAVAFCASLELPCGNKVSIVPSVGRAQLGNIMDIDAMGSIYEDMLAHGHKVVLFDKGDKSKDKIYADIRVAVECSSREVIQYADRWTSWRLHQPTGQLLPDAEGPTFMPEDKARMRVEIIAQKLPIPPDMIFDRMEKDREFATWTGYWTRRKNGYPYKGDGIAISIMGLSGEFVGYKRKYYMGEPESTEVKITENGAMHSSWRQFKKEESHAVLQQTARPSDLYRVKAQLWIEQVDKYDAGRSPFELLNKEKARLCWFVEYEFSGGAKLPQSIASGKELSERERITVDEYYKEVDNKWREMNFPPRHAKAIIDAITGAIVHFSSSKM